MYEIREAKEEDRDQSVELLIRTFKDDEEFSEGWTKSWRNYMNHPENGEWNIVAIFDSMIVGNLAFTMNENNSIRGGPAKIGCVWAVATDSEHRRRGVLRQIYELAFRSMKNRGITLSVLEPSSYLGAQIAYEKLGYECVEKRVVHEFKPESIRSVQIPKNIAHRRIDDENDWKIIAGIEKTMSRFGSVIYQWPGFLIGAIESGNVHVLERDGVAVASAYIGRANETLHILNAYFSSNDVLPYLLELIRQHAAGASKVIWAANQEMHIRPCFHNLKMLETKTDGAMMMRVVDFEGLCKTIKVPNNENEDITLKLLDHHCPWNEGVYHIEARKGKLNVARTNEDSVEITLKQNDVSRIIGGYASSLDWHRMGFLQCERRAAEKLDRLFPKDSFIAHFRF